MTDIEYKKLLNNIITQTDKEIVEDRFKMPKADIFYEGNTTVIKNFDKISTIINRDPKLILKYLLGGVGTAGEMVGNRVIFQGKIPSRQIQDKLKEYIDSFVICSECGKPDTHLVKKGRATLIRCDACGAFRSVKSRKKKTTIKPQDKTLKEGSVYELTIKDIGRKGDGVAFFDKYVVYVNGAVKGSTYKVKIEKVSGTVAFGRIV